MPTAAFTKKNFYKDSVALMRISQTVGGREGIARVSLLMGTPANKDILGQAGLLVAELAGAAPADLMILVEGEQGALAPALEAIEAALAGGDATPSAGTVEIAPRSIAMGQERLAGATLAQVSVPGPYAAAEALKALKRGLHVFLFSDNVPLAEEQAVKRLAAKKGLLVMGPDCGTAIIAGVPLGFANAVRRGANRRGRRVGHRHAGSDLPHPPARRRACRTRSAPGAATSTRRSAARRCSRGSSSSRAILRPA